MSLEERIKNAKTIEELNELRTEIVKNLSKELLKQWQKMYWDLKTCPACGKIIEEG